ncbi:Cilia- and flagella-associated protein 91 [Quaeritorhiza haematococci]|nr:Cilia- and flagella-associated protein 91 [Quaeritorhiza haematococci]
MFSVLRHHPSVSVEFRPHSLPANTTNTSLGNDRRVYHKTKPVVSGMLVIPKGEEKSVRGGRGAGKEVEGLDLSGLDSVPGARHKVMVLQEVDAEVAGMNRYKYFRRPLIPYMPAFSGGTVVYTRTKNGSQQLVPEALAQQQGDGQGDENKGPRSRTVGVQTMYRESSAQTLPYSPEYILPPEYFTSLVTQKSPSTPYSFSSSFDPKSPTHHSKGPAKANVPEILTLATLTYDHGLPAGPRELELIERARAKRAWEESLPPLVPGDQASFEKRLKMMEEMEMKEWREREEEIKRIQDARLAILAKVIKRREAENEALNHERVQRMWQRKLQEREALLEKMQRRKIKALRKLTDKRAKIENKIERRDIIAEYGNYGSKVYAPKARDGASLDKMSVGLHVDVDDLKTFTGLAQLEKDLPSRVLEPNVSRPDADRYQRNPAARRERHIQEQLRIMSEKLKERKTAHFHVGGSAAAAAENGSMENFGDMVHGGRFRYLKAKKESMSDTEKPLRFAVRIEKPPQRPPTPRVSTPPEEENEREMAALLLQRLIRGRIAQKLMLQGKERRLQLIFELRTRQRLERLTSSASLPTDGEDYEDLDEPVDPSLLWVQDMVSGGIGALGDQRSVSRRGARRRHRRKAAKESRAAEERAGHLAAADGTISSSGAQGENTSGASSGAASGHVDAQGGESSYETTGYNSEDEYLEEGEETCSEDESPFFPGPYSTSYSKFVAYRRQKAQPRPSADSAIIQAQAVQASAEKGSQQQQEQQQQEQKEGEPRLSEGAQEAGPSSAPRMPRTDMLGDEKAFKTIDSLFESNIQADYVGQALDFLTKELVRLREERKIAAMVMLAERTRRMREAEETGRRQAELARRQQEDEIFRQVMSVHKETVDSYLEDVIAGSVEHTASVEARQSVREYVGKLNDVVDDLEKRESQEPEKVVSDLVSSFLIPEVNRQSLRAQVKQNQRRYLLAAHRAVHGEEDNLEDAAQKTSQPKAKDEHPAASSRSASP